jgi:hypothetical protein
MTESINTAKVLEVLEKVVNGAADGPATTAECYYSIEGMDHSRAQRAELDTLTPMCIVGCAVFEVAGVEGLRGMTESEMANSDANRPYLLELGFTPEAVVLLDVAQGVQDEGRNWGEALEEAREQALVTA